MKWHTMPQDQGQIVVVEFADCGALGCLRRTTDRGEGPSGEPAYALARWSMREDRPFEPWNGKLGTVRTWRRISAEHAAQLIRAHEE